MAWAEQSGQHSWRVRYRQTAGGTSSVGGFHSAEDTHAYLSDMTTNRRRGAWIDPAAARTPLADWVQRWLPALDLDRVCRPAAAWVRRSCPQPDHVAAKPCIEPGAPAGSGCKRSAITGRDLRPGPSHKRSPPVGVVYA
ncbi:hypothetical protein SAMN05216266_11782 [Amycolatopsis marina]|uniref:Uncharacterized protein n=1 Tax=Amycolatopsis marina TaxID=490629 RepID=A0A1I1BYQ4_9PSEU|nr:hypothetical protein [Amycolatopsis marina]SFB53660.1 hypothetical protein SAMN05216266_11782 [Amycolatopsis marina]